MPRLEGTMEGKCIVSSCGKAASKFCGSCGWVRYCSAECQKEDWKKRHKKLECVNLKKMYSENLTEELVIEVTDRISLISDRLSAIGEDVRSTDVLKECIDFARDRLGQLNRNNSSSLIGDCAKLNSITICRLLIKLGQLYFNMRSSSESDSLGKSYTLEARELLVQRRDAGMDDMETLTLFWGCDASLSHFHRRRSEIEKAEYHSAQCLATARQYNGPNKTDLMIGALELLSICLKSQGKYPEALSAAQETYTIASKHYSLASDIVLRASLEMINCLIQMEDYSTADTYSRMNYENFLDPRNAGDYNAMSGLTLMNLIAVIWLRKEPDDDEIVEKALADEAIDLSRRAYASCKKIAARRFLFVYLDTLCEVLVKANQLTEETEGYFYELIEYCSTEYRSNNDNKDKPLRYLTIFYLKLDDSLPIGQKSKLVKENIELCQKFILEFGSSDDVSADYTKLSQIIKPYFKNNAELCI